MSAEALVIAISVQSVMYHQNNKKHGKY